MMQKKRDKIREGQDKGTQVKMGAKNKDIKEETKGKTEKKNKEKLERKIGGIVAIICQTEEDLFVIPAGE